MDKNTICPVCKGCLKSKIDVFHCSRCERKFSVTSGIVDFRVSAPFFFRKETEHEKVMKLLDAYDGQTFAGLVGLSMGLKNTHKDLLAKFTASVLGTVDRNGALLRRMETMFKETVGGGSALDIGCGSGGMLVNLSKKFKNVVGVDVSMESLILAKKLLQEKGCENVTLYCCGIESLPFDENSFDFISASNVIEHLQSQKAAITEIHRVQKLNGMFFADVPNRFSLKPEPHVNVKFVGFLPRRLGVKYVWLRRKRNYKGYLLPSYRELHNLISDSYAKNFKIGFFGVPLESQNKKIPILKRAISVVGRYFCDVFMVVATK